MTQIEDLIGEIVVDVISNVPELSVIIWNRTDEKMPPANMTIILVTADEITFGFLDEHTGLFWEEFGYNGNCWNVDEVIAWADAIPRPNL